MAKPKKALKPQKVPIVCASDLPACHCCGEPWCPIHQQHYADCACIGPHNAEEEGYNVVEVKGKFWGILQDTR